MAGGPQVQDGAPSVRPLFGSAQGGLRFELVRAADAGEGPFVTLHSGRFAQVLLARIAFGDAGVVDTFALKIQRHDYAMDGSTRHLTNPDVEAMWIREAEDLQRVRSPNVVATLPLPPELHRSRPVVLCTRTGAYFHPPCPETGQLLTVCQDDEFLRDCGLPAWSRSLVRYLYGGGDARATRTFYRVPGTAEERPRDKVTVRIGPQLFRDYGEALREGRLPAAALPCQQCPHRDECFPAGARQDAPIPAETLLVPVAYYDFRMLPLQLLDLPFDDFCDLAGGAAWQRIEARAAAPGCSGWRERYAALQPVFESGTQWLFRHDPRRFPLEVLRLKLTALAEVCEGLRAIHVQCGRPHLGVAPANAMVKVMPAGPGMPARWNCQVRLVDLGSAIGQGAGAAVGAADEQRLFEPGGELRGTPYSSARLAEHDGLTGRLYLRVKERHEEEDRVRLLLEAQAGALNLRAFRVGDLACLVPSSGAGEMWAQISEVSPGRLLASAELAPGHPLAGLAAQQTFEASCTFRKLYGTGSDLFGLGMLMFRLLLVHDGQDVHRVSEVVERCLQKIEVEAVSRGGGDQAARRLVQDRLREERAVFQSANVLFGAEDRKAGGDAIDAGLWQDLLTFAFRLTTWIPGFSFADSHAETHPHNRGALMAHVLSLVREFQRRVHAELFAADRDAEILAICQAALQELGDEIVQWVRQGGAAAAVAAAAAEAAAAGPAGCELRISQGSEPPVVRSFLQDQVTIGRKPENLLVLNHEHISSRHAILERSGDGYVLIDRNSTNGTFVNGEQVRAPRELQSGDTITIGPFTLAFTCGSGGAVDLEATMVVSRADRAPALLDELRLCYAQHLDAPVAERRAQLRRCVQERRSRAKTPKEAAVALHAVVDRLQPEAAAAPPPGAAARAEPPPAAASRRDPELAAKALLVLESLSKHFLGVSHFEQRDDVARFGEMLRLYVEHTLDYLQRTTQVRREVADRLELNVTQHLRREPNPIDRATGRGDMAQLLLGWPAGKRPEEAANLLERTLNDFTMMQLGLLKGGQQVVKSIFERLAPERLEQEARAGSGALGRAGVNMAVRSGLWEGYRAVYAQLTEDKRWDQDFLARIRDGYLKAHLKLTESPKQPQDES